MKTYPYHTPNGIIDLVEKREYDKLREELERENAAMREAIKDASEALTAWKRTGSGMSTDFNLQSQAFRTGQAAIAKLQPFLK